jgi:hypothetical protein
MTGGIAGRHVSGCAMRIQLKPGLPVVRRGPSTVQIGVDGRHGTLLDGLTEAEVHLLQELTTGIDDRHLALRPDAAPGHPAEAGQLLRARTLIGLLTATGVLQCSRTGRAALSRLGALRPRLAADAAAWSLVHPGTGDGWELLAARRHATVELRGGGRTALLLAATLAAAGVGTVRSSGTGAVGSADVGPGGAAPDDVGARVADVMARVVARATGEAGHSAGEREGRTDLPRTDLVVLVDRAAADPLQGDRLLAADIPHLSIVVRETSILVGPLVLPGRSACLRCLDLHRTDRDPQWPLVLAQLLQGPPDRRCPREETASAQVAAGVAALQVLGHLDGRRPQAGVAATLEIELPEGLASRRPWPAHPSCGCSWPPGLAGAP